MRPGKLYIKIFLYFLLVLIITEILIFGLFVFSAGRSFRYRFERYAEAQGLMVKEFIEEKIKSEPGTLPVQNESLKNFILRLGESYGAKVWLTAPDGTLLLKSFPGDIPDDIVRIVEEKAKNLGQFKIYRNFKRRHSLYLHISENMGMAHIEGAFALGLISIGIVIALLVIPVSRLITERVKRLRASAIRIAEGDLSHRVMVKGKDEIGELGRSFNRMADELERMIRGGRELTANVSHELRSPLARIRIAEELLRERLERGDKKDLNRHLDDIREDIEELDHLIGSILLLSKLDIQETALKLEPLDLSDMINELLKRYEPAISHSGLRVMTVLSSDQSIFGDRNALKTALSNILDNAVKFTPEKGHVIIKMHSERDFLIISVTNSFEELSKEELTRVFEPFYRTDISSAAGSGLGLAITKKIIERHGGTIEAINSDEGLKILIRLPAGQSERRI
jgi:two-component system sensor histidine kinase CpxA